MEAVIYARFSPRPNAAECLSIERQQDRCRAWCLAKGVPVAFEYSDADLSGASMENRPGFAKAISYAKLANAMIVATDLSRIARSTRDVLTIVEDLNAHDAELALLDQNVDTTTPQGRFFLTILAALGQLERETTSQRTSEAMLWHQSQGRLMGSVPPYGWRIAETTDGQILMKDEHEQFCIKCIMSLRKRGDTFREIARALEIGGKDSETKSRGERWHHSTVRRVWEREKLGL